MEHLLGVTVFALVSAITPGPNTLLAFSSGINFGASKSLPLLVGICTGFALMVLFVGLGLGQIFTTLPGLTTWVQMSGALYLVYLAAVIATRSPQDKQLAQSVPMGFVSGILFQWSNTKAWAVSLSAVAAFTTPGDGATGQTLALASIFLLAGLPCVGLWVLSGAKLRKRQLANVHLLTLNRILALMLLMTLVPVFREIL